jgi:hypothetical protein
VNFTTSTSEILVVVETLPKREKRLGAGLRTGIEQNADFRVENAANGSKQPSVGVDLLCVLLLQAEHHLHGGKRAGAVIVRADELLVRGDGQLCCVLELGDVRLTDYHVAKTWTYDVSDSLLAVDILLHDTILVDTDGSEQIERALVAGVDTVENKAHDNLLPSRTTLVPELGLFQVYDVADVLHDAMQRTGGEDLVLVVVGDGNEQLGVAVVHGRAQIVAILEREVVGVARGSGVWQLSGSRPSNVTEYQQLTSHVCELLAAALEVIAVLGLDGVLDGRWHGVVGTEDGALDELDLARHAALEAAGCSNGAAGLLALSPCRGRAGLAPRIGRGRPLRRAKVARCVVAARRRVDVGAVVGLAGVLCRPVGGICLGQAVGRVWAVVGLAVERVGVGARGILVEQRAAYLVLVSAVVLRLSACCSAPVVVIRGTYAEVRLAIVLRLVRRVVRHGVQQAVAGTDLAAAREVGGRWGCVGDVQ